MTLRIAPSDLGPPLHGFRGDESVGPFARTEGRARPKGLTVTISREAGARGGTIARKVGEFLGWQVFDQEMLDYLVQDVAGRAQLLADVPDTARAWADSHLANLQNGGHLVGDDPQTVEMFRLILNVAARGDAVIVGRGAGFVLPPESTVHVRIVSPFEARVSYLAQWLRLSREEAAAEARSRDDRRAKFLARSLRRDPNDPTAYDAVVNATRLGVEATAQFIGWAVRTKQQFAEIADEQAGA
jgi:cytidylate kinase